MSDRLTKGHGESSYQQDRLQDCNPKTVSGEAGHRDR